LALVAVAETGRIPVDNPDTHLELTMIHEAMILEYSGRHLALMEWAAQVKLMLYGVLLINVFFPWGIAVTLTPQALLWSAVVLSAKLALLAVVLAVGETVLAKMRLFRVPQFLNLAFLLAVLGLLSFVILESGA
jgi:formate hydrogenlyase subunit 4